MVASEDQKLTLIEGGGEGGEDSTNDQGDQSLVEILNQISTEDEEQQTAERNQAVELLLKSTNDLISGEEEVKRTLDRLREENKDRYLKALAAKEEGVKNGSNKLFQDQKAKVEFANRLRTEVEGCKDYKDLDRVVMKAVKTGLLECKTNEKGFVTYKSVTVVRDERRYVVKALFNLSQDLWEKFIELKNPQKEKDIKKSKKGRFTNNPHLKTDE